MTKFEVLLFRIHKGTINRIYNIWKHKANYPNTSKKLISPLYSQTLLSENSTYFPNFNRLREGNINTFLSIILQIT